MDRSTTYELTARDDDKIVWRQFFRTQDAAKNEAVADLSEWWDGDPQELEWTTNGESIKTQKIKWVVYHIRRID